MNKIVKQAAQWISSAEHILLICHIAPDGDAIGSLLGLGLALEQAGHDVTMACADPVPDACYHLPCWERITQSPFSPKRKFDLVISLDCSDPTRLGHSCDPGRLAGVPVINIDHHATNVNFGEINWVDTQAAATAQMLAELIREMDIGLSVETANCLLNGILTDTLGFRTSSTTAEVIETALRLMHAGASLPQLVAHIFNHRPMAAVRLWSAALQGMRLDGRILWSQITQETRQRIGYDDSGDGGLVNFLCTVNEADVAVVFDELENGSINVSMRAVPGYNISQVAFSLGGGGHPQAAGCTIPGPLPEARDKVLAMLRQAWDEQTTSRQAVSSTLFAS